MTPEQAAELMTKITDMMTLITDMQYILVFFCSLITGGIIGLVFWIIAKVDG